MPHYRSLDRGTHAAILLASLLAATTVFGSIVSAFGHAAPRVWVSDRIEEVVVRG